VLARRLEPGDPLAPLIALFVHGAPVSEEAADRALDPLGLDGALRLAIVRPAEGGSVTSTVRLAPFGDLLLASDRPEGPFHDFVMGGSGSSRSLANLTVRRPVATVLDIGTGSGVQALLASWHAGLVAATDVNPRALAFARFNARLNHVTNVEFLEGPWYEPVAGRQFDLVVANPPFVVSPDADYLFRDDAEPGDAVSRRLVEATPAHLVAGGLAEIMVSWVYDPDDSWSQPVRDWVAGRSCDAWLLHSGSRSSSSYAVEWNQHLAADPPAQAAAVERWLRWFESQEVRALAYGLILLHRHAGATWFRADEIPDVPEEPAGGQLERALAAHHRLSQLGDLEELLDLCPVATPRHRLEQILRPGGGRYEVEAARIRLDEPLPFTAEVDVYGATLLTFLDGSRTLRQAVDEASLALDDPPGDLPARSANLVAGMMAMGLVRLEEPAMERGERGD
jgi:SAM-dependent methyltransferase